jgi:hypothetical protein
MFMKQNYGHVFQLVKGCYALIGIRHYELNGEVSNIVAQMSPKCRNVLGPWTLTKCRGCNEKSLVEVSQNVTTPFMITCGL